MLPIISIDAKEVCQSGFSMRLGSIEPISDACWIDWQQATDAAQSAGMNLDRFLTMRIGSFFARKRLRSNVLVCYTPHQDRFVLSVCSKRDTNLLDILSSLPGYLEYGQDYLPSLAVPFIFWGGLQVYRLYCVQEQPTTSYYICDFGSLFGMHIEEAQRKDYERIRKQPEQYVDHSAVPVEPSEQIEANGITFVLQHAFCKWIRSQQVPVMTSQRKAQKVLERGEEHLTIDAETWANVLLVASKWGWRPSRPTYFFLASDFQVNNEEARALASTIERIWEAVSKDPFNLHLSVELSTLMNVGAFCLRGAFVVTNRGHHDS
jgi:hypothetical protein